MRRKSLYKAMGLLIGLLAIGGFVLHSMIKHVPEFYRNTTIDDESARRMRSGECVSQLSNLGNGILNRDRDWGEVFTAEQINAYFQEDFLKQGGDANLPPGVSDPRLRMEPEKLTIGFRYGTGFWSTILTLEIRSWLVANEVNLIGIEILNLKAGALPISPQLMLDFVSELSRQENMSIKWFRHQGNPVAILQYQADQVTPTLLIRRLELQEGRFVLLGRSTEPR